MNEHEEDGLADWERELLAAAEDAVRQEQQPPRFPGSDGRHELMECLRECAKHPDREYGQSMAEDALMDYLESRLVNGKALVKAYRDATSYYNDHNLRPA